MMNRNVDPEVLIGFVQEIKGYLPIIQNGIDLFVTDKSQHEPMEEAYRHAHSIKGSASMMGFTSLSHLAYHLEEILEQIAAGEKHLTPELTQVIRQCLIVIDEYIDRCPHGGGENVVRLDEMRSEMQQARDNQPSVPHPVELSESKIYEAKYHSDDASNGKHADAQAESKQEPEENAIPESPTSTEEQGLSGMNHESNHEPDIQREPDFENESDSQNDLSALIPDPDTFSLEGPPSSLLLNDVEPLEFTIPLSEVPIGNPTAPSDSFSPETIDKVVVGEASSSENALVFDEKEEISGELLQVFSVEAEDHLRTIQQQLPILKQQPANRDALQEIRRSVHTLKGSAAMVGFRRITHLAHRMEDLLDQLYEGQREINADIISLLFATADVLEDLSAGRKEKQKLQEIYSRYSTILDAESVSPASSMESRIDSPSVIDEPIESLSNSKDVSTAAPGDAVTARQVAEFLRVPIDRLDDVVKLVSELVISRSEFEQRLGTYIRQVEELQLSTSRLRRSATRIETQYEAKSLASNRLLIKPETLRPGSGNGSGNGSHHGPLNGPIPATFQSYGFDDLEFDRYTDFHLLSRELSETSTDLQTVGNELNSLHGDFDSYLTRQTRLTSELQDKLMRIRMVPLATLSSRLHRTVRNVADSRAKQVQLILEGQNTELDKTVMEEMAEPLLHLLRNAVDHGIEPPSLRQVKGKKPEGTIRVRAFPEGTQVVIEIRDDGNGIDAQRIRSSAVSKGFLTPAEAEAMTDDQTLNLIFQPGFSTASEVTEISGRGVGMDIVRAMVHRLKGTIALKTEVGKGTTFTIRLPLTLAILRGLLVKAGGQTFALPLANVKQLLRVDPENLSQIGTDSVLLIDDKVYPRVHLGRALNLKNPVDESVQRPQAIILDLGDKQLAILVDQIFGGREIVVKNLGTHLRRVPGIAGATLMGDGGVVLIVNPNELQQNSVITRAPTVAPVAVPPSRMRMAKSILNVMVVDDSPSVRRIVTSLMKSAGWNPIPAKDGLEALEILNRAEELPDVMVLDIEMPRMDGYELLSTIRSQPNYNHIPVVMVTSRAGEKHRRKAMDLGANSYLIKPYQDEVLLQTLRQLTGLAQEKVNV